MLAGEGRRGAEVHRPGERSNPSLCAGRGFTRSWRLSKNLFVSRRAEGEARSGSDHLALVDELKQVAAALGFEVREEKLLREVGYRVRSGSCRVGAARVILLDRGLPPSAQIEVLVEELAACPLDNVYLSPAARGLLERAAPSRAATP